MRWCVEVVGGRDDGLRVFLDSYRELPEGTAEAVGVGVAEVANWLEAREPEWNATVTLRVMVSPRGDIVGHVFDVLYHGELG